MSRIRFLHNKESVIGLSLTLVFLALIGINIFVLASSLLHVYGTDEQTDSKTPINAQTVMEAIEYLDR